MPDRKARQRLADWRAAEQAESLTNTGSTSHRRAVSATRRARWAYEDAARAERADQGIEETATEYSGRAVRRLREAGATAAALNLDQPARVPDPESAEQLEKRMADDAEFARELGDG